MVNSLFCSSLCWLPPFSSIISLIILFQFFSCQRHFFFINNISFLHYLITISLILYPRRYKSKNSSSGCHTGSYHSSFASFSCIPHCLREIRNFPCIFEQKISCRASHDYSILASPLEHNFSFSCRIWVDLVIYEKVC
ncbi:unnamed protein product [Moneuplotes crassus]|uniref:Uncharacterized protein n=1 Tax=Euplotes crassus TaxID=5936 RepID=A0AAD1XGK7_EUPCR|nr:unnamed protein product [Moneuplotes crassus]